MSPVMSLMTWPIILQILALFCFAARASSVHTVMHLVLLNEMFQATVQHSVYNNTPNQDAQTHIAMLHPFLPLHSFPSKVFL